MESWNAEGVCNERVPGESFGVHARARTKETRRRINNKKQKPRKEKKKIEKEENREGGRGGERERERKMEILNHEETSANKFHRSPSKLFLALKGARGGEKINERKVFSDRECNEIFAACMFDRDGMHAKQHFVRSCYSPWPSLYLCHVQQYRLLSFFFPHHSSFVFSSPRRRKITGIIYITRDNV